MSPWRRNPWLTTQEADLLRAQPSIKDVGYREGAGGPVSYEDVKLSSVSITGFTTNWPMVSGGTITQGRNWTDIEFAAVGEAQSRTNVNDGRGRSLTISAQAPSKTARRLAVSLLAIELHGRLVLLPRLLPRRDLERMPRPPAGDEHGRPRLLRHGAPPGRRRRDGPRLVPRRTIRR